MLGELLKMFRVISVQMIFESLSKPWKSSSSTPDVHYRWALSKQLMAALYQIQMGTVLVKLSTLSSCIWLTLQMEKSHLEIFLVLICSLSGKFVVIYKEISTRKTHNFGENNLLHTIMDVINLPKHCNTKSKRWKSDSYRTQSQQFPTFWTLQSLEREILVCLLCIKI